jgi:glycosyltransferase involved in cell wall biosynthesis
MGGCCLVLADLPTLRELWEGAAVFFDAHDSHSLAMALNSVIDDAPYRDRMARAAVERAAEYSSRAMAQRYVALYRDMLHGQHKARKAVA